MRRPTATLAKALVSAMVTVLAAFLVLAGLATPAAADPPTPPGEAQARDELAALQVADEGSMDGYDRDRFPHWNTVEGSCDTREWVLRRDGTDVQTGSDCYPTSGTWFSAYDGVTLSQASDVDIDHVVPLAEAWRSGASGWTDDRRSDFANDLDVAQLWAVNDDINSEKSDSDPDQWMPPRTEVRCLYARSWIHVKSVWGLNLEASEKSALTSMLDAC
ncbi:MAG: DUF1524 domain-containing protein [Streptosporangiales bacterium]|nr:DUF1524 domain-containing protein [Streptosporangiales bacterium]